MIINTHTFQIAPPQPSSGIELPPSSCHNMGIMFGDWCLIFHIGVTNCRHSPFIKLITSACGHSEGHRPGLVMWSVWSACWRGWDCFLPDDDKHSLHCIMGKLPLLLTWRASISPLWRDVTGLLLNWIVPLTDVCINEMDLMARDLKSLFGRCWDAEHNKWW